MRVGAAVRIVPALFIILMCVSAARTVAGDMDDYSTAGLSCQGMKLTVCPGGDFEQIRNGCGGTGAYIWIEARPDDVPQPGIPVTDFWINACNPATQLSLCAQPIIADSMTGANGRTTFSGILRAGGCALTGGIWIAIQGRRVYVDPPNGSTVLCLDIIIKSPDLVGRGGPPDGVVDLSDLIPFGFSYNKNLGQAGYNACCDYNDDNHCNLSDFAFFATHYQHGCQ